MSVSDNTIKTDRLGDFFNNLVEKGLNVSKKLAKKVSKDPSRALEIGANAGSAIASRSPKAALPSLAEVIKLYHAGKRLYLEKIV